MLPQPAGVFRVVAQNRIDGISAVDSTQARDKDLKIKRVQRKGLPLCGGWYVFMTAQGANQMGKRAKFLKLLDGELPAQRR